MGRGKPERGATKAPPPRTAANRQPTPGSPACCAEVALLASSPRAAAGRLGHPSTPSTTCAPASHLESWIHGRSLQGLRHVTWWRSDGAGRALTPSNSQASWLQPQQLTLRMAHDAQHVLLSPLVASGSEGRNLHSCDWLVNVPSVADNPLNGDAHDAVLSAGIYSTPGCAFCKVL